MVERDRIDTRIAELTLARDRLDDIIDATSRPNAVCDYA